MSIQTQAILAGLAAGLGLTLLLAYLAPAPPALRDALDRLSGKPATDPLGVTAPADAPQTRLQAWTLHAGRLAYPWLTRHHWLRIPTEDLAILHRSTPRFLGDKLLSAAVGLIAPSVLNAAATASGTGLPWRLPALVGIAAAIGLFFVPDLEVRRRAAAAREELRRGLGAYVELAALCRNAGIGVTQSLEIAARVAHTWMFNLLWEALTQASYSGKPAWTALETVGGDLGVPEMSDIADIMAISGAHGTSVYKQLRAAGANMRNERLAAEQGDARSATQKMSAPIAGLAVLFFVLLLIPALHNILNG
ncbi:type II secretion system F family protein [Nocardia transvalensis]|uniref:type II secretion system F family protein n=1 Tax=Nocardia transvalensis TaxID=37333 RepID=UPI001896299B|nr:type II secretion system F family protein [Nocardia transvalensis]MBF6333625.1 type II secretion system F family protein [Nocardia transvalensis]